MAALGMSWGAFDIGLFPFCRVHRFTVKYLYVTGMPLILVLFLPGSLMHSKHDCPSILALFSVHW